METYKFVDVIEVEELDYTEDVYDITVEDNHNFFANGVVVHNCLGGTASGVILRGLSYNRTSQQIICDLENLTDRFVDTVGRDNFFLEIQFNKLPKQHHVNKHLIDLSRKTGVKLLATCDSHYPDPSKWQARELYKKLGWMGQKLDEASLPKFEDLKCELYPKNASQMWDEYKVSYEQYDFYRGTEEEIRDAIERTHDIAWNDCEDVWIDTKAKLPHFGTSEKSSFRQLVELLKEKLNEQGYAQDQAYVSRLKEELEVVKAKEFADYFLTLYSVLKKASERAMVGPGRGSGTGSLINYLLEITNVDPIKYDLLFSRFINMGRKGFPDVDCLHEDHLVVTGDGKYKRLGDIEVGETVLGGDRSPHTVTAAYRRQLHDHEPPIVVFVRDNPTGTLGSIRCIPRHKFVKGDGSVVYAHDLLPGDVIMSSSDVSIVSIEPDPEVTATYVDVTVADDHRFVVVPFDVVESDCGLSSEAYSIAPSNSELLHP